MCVGSMCENSKYVKYLFSHMLPGRVSEERRGGEGERVEGRKGGPGFSAQVKDKGKEGTWKREGKKILEWSLPWRIRARSIIL